MDISKIKEIVQAIVAETMVASPENATILKEVEEVLLSAKSKIEELTAALVEKTSVLEGMAKSLDDAKAEQETLTSAMGDATSQVENLEAALSVKTTELEGISAQLSETSEKLSVVEKELGAIKLDVVVSGRAEELEKEGVLRSDDAGEAQRNKIRDMNDEAFVAYKAELVSFRDELLATAAVAPVLPVVEMVVLAPSEKYKDFGKSLAEKMGKSKNKK